MPMPDKHIIMERRRKVGYGYWYFMFQSAVFAIGPSLTFIVFPEWVYVTDIPIMLGMALLPYSFAYYVRWIANKYHPEIVQLNENGITISTFHFPNIISIKYEYIPFDSIRCIYPNYNTIQIGHPRALERTRLRLSCLGFHLEDGREFYLEDDSKETSIAMWSLLKRQLGESWTHLFDEFHIVKTYFKKHDFDAIDIANKTGELGKDPDLTCRNFLLCLYYERKTGEKIFPPEIGPINPKYKSLRNVQQFQKVMDRHLRDESKEHS